MQKLVIVPLLLPVLVALGSAVSCAPPQIAKAPDGNETSLLNPGKDQCSGAWKRTEVNLMGWDGSSRAALAAVHRRAAVAVQYRVQYLEKGCVVELELLPNCAARASYTFESSPAADHLLVHNSSELFAALPLGAASLQGELRGDRLLRTDYMLSGIDSLPVGAEFSKDDLIGSGCERATHIVSRVYLGGFARSVGDRSSLEASAGFFGVGANGSNRSDSASTHTEGNADDCSAAQKDGQPRAGCSTPLGVGLVPLAGVEREACSGELGCRAQCEGGDTVSCNQLGILYDSARPAQAAPLYSRACTEGLAEGCVNLGRLCVSGRGVPKDVARAVTLLDQGCRGGDGVGCEDLGVMYEAGNGVERNENIAAQYLALGCKADVVTACGRVTRYLDISCRSGDLDACLSLGTIVEEGRGVPPDARAAIGIYQVACDGGNYDGCWGVAKVYLNGGRGVPPDPEKGAAILVAGCNAGQKAACAGLGTVYMYGRGMPENAVTAFKYFDKACSIGESNSCATVAYLLTEGKGTEINYPRAFELGRRACDGGVSLGCHLLGKLYEEGKGTPVDLPHAKSLYQQACQADVTDSCAALRRLGVQ